MYGKRARFGTSRFDGVIYTVRSPTTVCATSLVKQMLGFRSVTVVRVVVLPHVQISEVFVHSLRFNPDTRFGVFREVCTNVAGV